MSTEYKTLYGVLSGQHIGPSQYYDTETRLEVSNIFICLSVGFDSILLNILVLAQKVVLIVCAHVCVVSNKGNMIK